MALRAAYILMGILVAATISVAGILMFGEFGVEPVQAVQERQPEMADVVPLTSNAEIKANRLSLANVQPEPAHPASVSLETARFFMAVPVTRFAAPTPTRPRPTNALLDDQQIASIKTRLRLTASQEKYWPPVEKALRDFVDVLTTSRRQSASAGTSQDAFQRLLAAAAPLMKQLREDQRDQIKSLMRIAGLGTDLPALN